jgi:carbamoyltransferase
MQNGALGPEFSESEILEVVLKTDLPYTKFSKKELFEKTAKLLADGKVIGWFQGRMEFGPRALGNRSIIADAAHPTMQQTLNLKIKKRESFRPFAPILLEDELTTYFENAIPNEYMLFVYTFRKELQIVRPDDFFEKEFSEMLKIPSSPLPAITHIDYTARIQTVAAVPNSPIWNLLMAFKAITGRGVLVNTSFNVKDEPIVCNPADAIQCFLSTEMDFLVIGDFIIEK